MPLWGANTANTGDKPKWLNSQSNFYNAQDVAGVNSSQMANGMYHKGWVHTNPGDGAQFTFTVNDGGTLYASGETVRVSNVGATNASGTTIVNPATGAIVGVTFASLGTANSTNLGDAVINVSRQLANLTVAAQSVGFQNGWSVTFSGGGGGSGANVTISTNSTGGVTGFNYNSYGTGYFSAPTANIGQALGNVTIGAGGTNYVNGAYLTVSGGGGSGANISLSTNSTGGITGFTYNSRGNNYTSAPTLTAPTGTGATLTATLPGSNGSLTAALSGSGANITVSGYRASSGRTRSEVLVAL